MTDVSPGQLRRYEEQAPYYREVPILGSPYYREVPILGPGSPPSPPPTSPIDRIKLLQLKLNEQGANLTVDGVLGPKTLAAMRQYGLDVNGNSTPAGPAAAASSVPPSATTAAPAAAPADPRAIEDQIRQKYGYLGTILLDNPEIHKVLTDAITGGWQPAQVTGALMNTQYWKTTQDSVRQWAVLQGADPATAEARIGTQLANIQQTAGNLGITIGADRLRQLATDSLKFGWGKDQLDQAIGNEFHYVPGAQAGAIGRQELGLKQMAGDYLIPLSDSTLGEWEGQIARNPALSAEDFRKYLVDQAKSLFPNLTPALDQGITVRQYVEPYRQIAAKDLELSPDAIDFTQPKWNKAISAVDPKTNQRTSMSLSDFQTMIRQDPTYGFTKTQGARDLAYALEDNLQKTFGNAA